MQAFEKSCSNVEVLSMLQFFQILEKFSIKKSRKIFFYFKKIFFHFLCIVEISIWEHLKIVLEH